jgi:Ca2+-binding RTX toxin-like protein
MPAVSLTTSVPTGSQISLKHFGVNFIDPFEPASISGSLDLTDILDTVGAVTVRWPGGSDIEKYAISVTGTQVDLVRRAGVAPPSTGEETLSMNVLDSFFAALATEPGAKAIIEIPTFWLVAPDVGQSTAYGKLGAATKTEASVHATKIEAFVEAVIAKAQQYGVEIAGFEIGNEYRGYFTAAGYTGVLNAVLDDVAKGIADSGLAPASAPQIIVQIDDSSNNRTPAELAGRNNTVLTYLEPAARAHVDAVTVHYYYEEGEMPGSDATWQESYDRIDDWIREYAAMGNAWSAGGATVDVMFSEWGVSRNLPGNTAITAADIATLNFGMMAMAPTLEIFSQMLQNGADALSIWPTRRPHATGLFNDSGMKRPLGVLFDVMAEALPGKQALEVNTGGATAFDIHAFLGQGAVGQTNATAFVSSLTDVQQTVTIKLEDLHALSGGIVSIQVIELRPGTANGTFTTGANPIGGTVTYTGFTDWSDPDALADLNTRTVASVTNPDGSISLVLDAYEIAVIRYEAFDTVRTSSNYYDSAAGTDDRVFGTSGNDWLRLGAGRDSAQGGLGDDALYAGDGDDTLLGEGGNDYLVGGNGRDSILGGIGNDTVVAGNDNDRISGEDGADSLQGEAGSDTLTGGAGVDTLTGGAGSDAFVFNTATSTAGIDRITDFNVVDDTIWLEDQVFTALAPGQLATTAFVANVSGLATLASHRLIYETDTGFVFYDPDGSGAGARIQIATLATNRALTNADFLVI